MNYEMQMYMTRFFVDILSDFLIIFTENFSCTTNDFIIDCKKIRIIDDNFNSWLSKLHQIMI